MLADGVERRLISGRDRMGEWLRRHHDGVVPIAETHCVRVTLPNGRQRRVRVISIAASPPRQAART
jgi:hypothetical protein